MELGPKLFAKVIITQQKLLLAKKELLRLYHVDEKEDKNSVDPDQLASDEAS